MAQGIKTGGRKKGTPNKKTQELRSLLEGHGHDPVKALVNAAMDESIDDNMKVKINIELLSYIYPKRKAVELSSDEDSPLAFVVKNA